MIYCQAGMHIPLYILYAESNFFGIVSMVYKEHFIHYFSSNNTVHEQNSKSWAGQPGSRK